MPWCPKCKDEYREGITVCADCGCELVDDLSLVSEDNQDFDADEIEQAAQMLQNATPEQLEKLAEQFKLQLESEEKKPAYEPAKIYVNNEEKAEENRSSAYALTSIGIIGIVAIILVFFEVISFSLSKFGKYMICGVMGVLFVLFFIMGLVSLRNFKRFKRKAYRENNLTKAIKDWCLETFSIENVDQHFDFEDTPDEVKYFGRIAFMKDAINRQYMNLDEAYVNRLVEEIYPDIFEQ